MNAHPAIFARFDVRYPRFALQANLDLPGRGVTVLFGHSGCGKTTLLRAIAGLERHRGGYLAVNGEVWQDDAKRIFMPAYRRALGYVFQEASLFPHLSVKRNLEYGWRRVDAATRHVDMARRSHCWKLDRCSIVTPPTFRAVSANASLLPGR